MRRDGERRDGAVDTVGPLLLVLVLVLLLLLLAFCTAFEAAGKLAAGLEAGRMVRPSSLAEMGGC